MGAIDVDLDAAVGGGRHRHGDSGGKYPRNAPEADPRVDQHGAMSRRVARRGLAAQVEGLAHRDPHRQRQIVVRQLAQQQPVERAAVGNVGNAPDRQILAIGDRTRQVHRGEQLSGHPRYPAQFLVVAKFGDQPPNAVAGGRSIFAGRRS